MDTTGDAHSASIMIVDDDGIFRNMLQKCLDRLHFHVIPARNGQEALELLRNFQPDIILLDVLMADMDGFETCRRLKANHDTRDIPVIFVTALTDVVDKVQGFETGAADYITKPIQIDEVVARITAHLATRKQQQTLHEHIAERDQAIMELNAFSHTVAHDLKNPLSHVAVVSKYLQDEWRTMSPTDVDEFMTTVSYTSSKACRIIDELLLLASLRHDEIEFHVLTMDEILDEVLRILAHMTAESHAEIIRPSGWPRALGYGPWVEEVWANYISNAVKYGGHPPVIELGADRESYGAIRFWVRDNGRGLTREEQAKLFMPFTRLEQVRVKGYGLGLSIVRRIVEKLGGHVGIESEPGEGTLFYFTLPAAVDETCEYWADLGEGGL